MESVLEVQNLVKTYGAFRAVDGISFVVPRGKVVGLLGPNGAGKTTTMHMLLGITLHNGGSIAYFGKDFVQHRQACLQRINFVSAYNTLQGRISVYENLLTFAGLYSLRNPHKKIMELLAYFEISDCVHRKYRDLSAGQRTRVNLAKSLLNDPELILMDEPTASLDPDIADKTLTLIEELRRTRGVSLLFTSHDMNEVTRLCDEVIFLDHGRVVAHDTPLGLTKRITASTVRITFEGMRTTVEELLTQQGYEANFPQPYTVVIATEEARIPDLIFNMSRAALTITDIEIKKPTLEDVFLHIARNGQ